MIGSKFLMVPVLVAGLGLSACDTTSDAANVAAEISNAQKIAVQICGYLPAVSTVTGLIGVFSPQAGPFIDVANQVAQSICNAVGQKSSRRRSDYSGIVIYGVPVRGRFVN